jgi:hypothetical protein
MVDQPKGNAKLAFSLGFCWKMLLLRRSEHP